MKYRVTLFIEDALLSTVIELLAPHTKVIVSSVDDGKPPVAAVATKSVRGRRFPIGHRDGAKGGGVIVAMTMAKNPAWTLNDLRDAFKHGHLNPGGVNATLSRMRDRGYLRHMGEGVWQLTAKGEALAKKYGDQVQGDLGLG